MLVEAAEASNLRANNLEHVFFFSGCNGPSSSGVGWASWSFPIVEKLSRLTKIEIACPLDQDSVVSSNVFVAIETKLVVWRNASSSTFTAMVSRAVYRRNPDELIPSDQYQWSTRTPWLNIGSIYSYTGGPTRGTYFRWSGKGLRYVAAQPFLLGRYPKCVGCSKGPYSSIFKHQSTPVEWTMSYLLKGSMRLCRWTYMGVYGSIWWKAQPTSSGR